ncbi:MAG: phosphomethylpyrimidine kinase, partial [Candidatus Aminicenantes bacterium]|nr:phosphomethylpyrimidine kinase [Candidatus Aminicenantes bacterium]
RVMPVTPRAVDGQFARLAEAVEISGIKAGMLATAANLSVVAGILAGRPGLPRVLDPVFRSTSGTLLLRKPAWPRYLAALRGKADLITPNLDEAGILASGRVTTVAGMKDAAERIAGAGRMACLVKGGHLANKAVDVLCDGQDFTVFDHPRLDVGSVHGTGCYLSSAILAFMAEGRTVAEACGLAIERIGEAIRDAVPAGGGRRVFDLSRERSRPRTRARKRR